MAAQNAVVRCGHIDDDSLGRTIRLGAALWALPQDPEPDEEDPDVVAARAEVCRYGIE